MRTGWEQKRLSQVCEIKPPKNEARLKLKETDLVTFLPMEDLGVMAKEISATKERKLKDVIGGYTYFAENDVLLAKITPCFENGKVGIAKGLKNGVGFGSSEYVVFRCQGNILSEYLFYFLSREQFREEGCRAMTGAVGHKRVSKDFIENYIIPFPKSLSEQKRIVSILDEAFAAIDRAKANVEKNLRNARELFESYLEGVFGNPGADWEERRLSEVAITFGRGKSKHRPRNDDRLFGGEYPFIQTGDVRNSGKYITTFNQTYNATGLMQSKLWPKGTICITIAANIAETAILDFDSCFPDSIIGLIVDPKKADLDYTYYALQFLKADLQLQGKGSAQDNINLGTFENQNFPFPPLSKQKQIVKILDSLQDETQELEIVYRQKLKGLEELKKSILQKAFAGELTHTTENIPA